MTSEIGDAGQQTLPIVARRLRTLKKAASFAGWLFTVVHRECQRLSRKMFRHEGLDEEHIKAHLTERSTDELRTELAFAPESPPAHYLEMTLLRDFEEVTIAEICERLDVSVVTAKARLRRARILVRGYLLGADQSSPAGAASSENTA
ncbi:RNA polymerase sigma factor [Methylocystis sp.]|uniref:RNA polymerase sigma factor n=1 Tax=Methylocystis sp. TaxID=1911079 RepID=UPI003D10AEA6